VSRTRAKKGDLVEIRFHDHCEDGDDAMEFLVWGRVRRVTRSSYIVESWAYANPKDDDGDDEDSENRKIFVIVKKAVLALRIMPVDQSG